MNNILKFAGRGVVTCETDDYSAVMADPECVLCMVTVVGRVHFLGCYCRMAVINRWGMRLVNPFWRQSSPDLRSEWAEYSDRDIHVFRPAMLQMLPEQSWMNREYY